MGKDLSWSAEKPVSGFAKAQRVQIGLICNKPNLRRTLSASSKTLGIFSSASTSVTPANRSHSSIRISAHSSKKRASLPNETTKLPNPTSLCNKALSKWAGV